MDNIRRLIIFATMLLLRFLIALDSMWGLIHRNVYYEALRRIRDDGPRVLPGSMTPIRAHYTGLTLVDYWLAVMNTVLANVTDGSALHLSLYSFQFAGQLGAMNTVLIVEETCQGHRGMPLTWFLPWGLAMTAVGYAVVMPLYGFAYLFFSLTPERLIHTSSASKSPIPSVRRLSLLPRSIMLGYVLPTVLMAMPSFSKDIHQLFVGGWHFFPLWLTLDHSIRSRFSKLHESVKDTELEGHHGESTRICLRFAYRFAFLVSAITHLTALIITVYAQMVKPSWSAGISVSAVFVPLPRSHRPMENFVQGTLDLLQHDQYVGSLAALLWSSGVALLTTSEARSLVENIRLIFEYIFISILAGPAATVALMRQRTQEIEYQVYRNDANTLKPRKA